MQPHQAGIFAVNVIMSLRDLMTSLFVSFQCTLITIMFVAWVSHDFELLSNTETFYHHFRVLQL